MTDIDILLTAIGMPDYLGRRYISAIVEMGLRDAFALDRLTECAYWYVSKQFRVGYTSVERDMRLVILRWWEAGGGEVFEQVTGIRFTRRPKNHVFLRAMVDVLWYQGVYVMGLIGDTNK